MEEKNKRGLERREIKPHEQNSYLERKSNFRIDFRQRLDLFAKSILLISGGALTISISIFLKGEGVEFQNDGKDNLKLAWALLFFTIASFVISYFIVLIQGFYVNSIWDGKVPLSDDQISGNRIMTVFRAVIILAGTSGFIAFLFGFYQLACVAISSIK